MAKSAILVQETAHFIRDGLEVEYGTIPAKRRRTSSSVPSYSRSSSLSDDTSSRFSASRERAAEPRRFTASTLTAADIISKYSPANYLGGSGGGGGGGAGGGAGADVGRPPLGARASAAHASASPAGDDKDAGVTTRSGTLRGRAATVAASTAGVGRVAAPSLERRSRLPKEVNGRAAGAAGSGNNNASDSESSSVSSSSSSPSRADDDDNGNGAAPARVSEIRRRFDAASSAASAIGDSGGHLAGGLAPDVPRLHHGAAAPVGGASSRRSALAAAAAPSPTPARKAYALAAPAAPPPAPAPAPAAAAAAASSDDDDDDSEEEEDEDAKSASEESSEEEAAGSEGGDAARAMTQPPPRRRPPERAAPTEAGAGSPGERRAAAYGARASVAAAAAAASAAAPVASTTGAYSRTHRSSASDSGQWAGWRPSDLPAPPARTSNLQPHDAAAAAHSTRRSSTLSTDYSYYPYRPHGSGAGAGAGAGASAGAALGVALNAVAGPSRDSSILSSSPHLARAGSRCTGSERGGLSGLRNIGNTCFMNSVIQCLSNTKPLLEYLLGDAYLSDINSTVSNMKGALIKAFSSVIQELWRENDGMVVNTTSLKSQIQRFAPRFMGYSQQDAQEFLRYLLEGLHEDVNRVTSKPKPILTEIDDSLSDQQKSAEAWKRYLRMDDSKVVDIFVGQLKSTLRCTVCGHCSVTFDPFWDLSLPIPTRTGQVRLQQCLDSFTREEVLDGDEKPTCAKCQTRRKCTKSFTIQKFPKILVLHLKRFSPTERFRGKLSGTVDFPHTGLDMSAYAASRGQGCMYNLYAISNHSGTTYSGHYTAYCRHPYTGEWHEYNDSRVSSISPRSIVSSEAYVLFYELSGHSSHL